MKDAPFIYGSTVSIESFTNREEDAARLQGNLLNGINTTIISPRRWGKSSLVEKVISDINKKDKHPKTLIIDLFTVSNEEEFLELFAREVIKASTPKWQEWVNGSKTIFKNLLPKISVGVDPHLDFKISFDLKELKKHSDEVLNLPEVMAKKHKIKFIICLDEFQNLSSYKGYIEFEKKMRACWQRQKSVTYCLYGSKRHMMADIFNNPSKPFYRFGDIMMLPKIHTEKWVTFITEGFEKTNKHIDATTAVLIPQLMKNHSYYVQQLAHYTWNLTQKKATPLEVGTALKELVHANTPLYQNQVEQISGTQLNLLKATACGETQFTGTAAMQQYALGTSNNVLKNKAILINADMIQETGNLYEFVDPVFELWFKKQFLNQPYPLLNSNYH